MDQVKFRAMKDGDAADYAFLTKHEIEHTKGTASRLLNALVGLDEGLSGYQITRLGHSLQSATRAERDGADIDWVVSTLLHDIGDIFAPYNHDEYIITTNMQLFYARSCASNAAGSLRNMATSKCSIVASMWVTILTNAKPIADISILTIAPYSMSSGTKTALTQTMTPCLSAILRNASKRFLPAKPMIHRSFDPACETL